jgi:hypothetical protein
MACSIPPSTATVAPAPAPAAASATATATAIVPLAGFVDRQRSPVLHDAIERVDGRFGVLLAGEVHEGETARLPRHAIGDHVDLDYVAAAIGAKTSQCFFVGIERQIPDVNPSSHF